MTDYKKKLFTQSSVNAVVLTGFLGFLMHPFVLFGTHFPDLGFLAWFYLVPLILGIHRHRLGHKFILCFLSGIIAHYGKYFWLMTAMQEYGGLTFFEAILALTLMGIILSLFFAVFVSLASWANHVIRLPFFFLLPVFMVTHDFVLDHFPLGGFPWAIAPYSQGQWLSFFQWVDHTGVFGLGLFLYIINGLIAEGLLLFIHRRQIDRMVTRFLIVVVLVFVSLFGSFLASQSYERAKAAGGSINVALIQGNIDQHIKWDPYKAQDNLNVYLKLSNTAAKDGARVIIWPETAYPYGIRLDKIGRDHFLDRPELPAPLLFGAVVSARVAGEPSIFNSVILADEAALLSRVYRKIHLVPFGEYLPFKNVLGFLGSLTRSVGEFTPGSEYTLFTVDGVKFGVLICFEDIFPRYARRMTLASADVLVNVTNDAWYGDSSAQYHHLVFSQFRALENRRYLVRATNTGITAVIDPHGEVIDRLEPFKEGYLLQSLKLDQVASFYTRRGNAWVSGVVIVCGLIFLYAVVKCLLGPVRVEF